MILHDSNLDSIFSNRIIQTNNFNSNSELFVFDDQVLKIYNDDDERKKYNINTIKRVMNHQRELKSINELVLPNDFVTYNNHLVGFSMPYIKGVSIEDIINNELFSENEMYIIFIKLLNTLDGINLLPINFVIGDMHEKNVIVSDYLNINIIDCDSFIINNKKIFLEGDYHIGKYINYRYNKKELKHLKVSCDYYCLLCMILNYLFMDVIEDPLNPVDYLRKDEQFNTIKDILDKTDNLKDFSLSINDIDRLFNFKKELIYIHKESPELNKELKRVRKIYKELGGI